MSDNIPMVKVSCYCSMFVGPPKWQNTEVYEPDECDTYFEAEVPLEEWGNKCASVVCPKCGSEL